jgi:hypothetical protein
MDKAQQPSSFQQLEKVCETASITA